MRFLNTVEIGERLLRIRKKRGLTQSNVAEKAGLSDRAYADIERGTTNMRVDTALKLCNALKVMPNDILIDEDQSVQTGVDLLVKLNSCTDSERAVVLKLIDVFLSYLNQ